MRNRRLRLWIVLIALNLMNFAQMVEAAGFVLATSPLANSSTTVVRPNIMFVLDNSGSMRWDYLPDYVSGGTATTGSKICWDGINDTSTLATCNSATTSSPLSSGNMTSNEVELPMTAPDINYVYYNPATYYQPPIKADKTNYANISVNAAYTDGFALSGSTKLQNNTTTPIATITGARTLSNTITGLSSSEGLLGSFVSGTGIPSGTYVTAVDTTLNTVTLSANATSIGSSSLTFTTGAYPHQVYCNTGSPTAQNLRGNGSVCKETTDTTSDSNNLFPATTAPATYTQVKSYNGAPYYYSMSPLEYCTDSVLTDCVYSAPDATHAVAAKYRWCNTYVSASQSFTGCQDLRNATHTIPDYLGGIIQNTPAVQASADLIISSNLPGQTITGITINGTNVIGVSTFTAGTGTLTSTHNIALAICAAIRSNQLTSGYNCPTDPAGASSTLTIKANIPPAFASYGGTAFTVPTGPNGNDVLVKSESSPGVPTPPTAGSTASGTLTITSSGATKVDDITVGGTSIIATASKPFYFPNTATPTSIASGLVTLINNNSGSSGYSATSAGAVITIRQVVIGANTGSISFTATGVAAKATLTTANSNIAAGTGSIGIIKVSATTLDNAQVFAVGATPTTVASQIRTNLIGATGFTATSATNVTTFTAPVGNSYNGQTITVVAGGIAAISPVGTLTITDSGATRVNDITVNGVSTLSSKPFFFGDAATSASICTQLAALITANSFTATCAGSTLTITAPAGTTYNGKTISMTGTAVSAKGTLTSTAAVGATTGSTGIISAGGTTIQNAQTFAAGSSTGQVALQIGSVTAFQNGFIGTSAGAAVTITAPAGNNFNGAAISVNAGTTSAGTSSSGTLVITDGNTTTGVANSSKINTLTCGGTNTIATNTVSAGSPGLIANLTTALAANDANGYTISGCTAPSGSPQKSTCNITGPAGGSACTLAATYTSSPGFSVTAGSLAAGVPPTASYTSFSQVPFAAASNGASGTASAITNAGYDAASGSGTMNSVGAAAITDYSGSLTGSTFPAAANPAAGSATATANAGYNPLAATGGSLSGGAAATGVISNNASASGTPSTLQLGGGVDAAGGRANVGKFTRVDIVPSTASYTKAGGRTDCAGASCTYAEELQNFANWYSYYRTRMLMMKTTTTLAFDQLDSKYRVGFDLLSNYGSNTITAPVAQFVDTGGETANQRTSWWSDLTTADGSSGTPLRSILLKMGKYYAGKLTSAAAVPAVPAKAAKGSLTINSTTSNGAVINAIKIENTSVLSSAFTVSGCSSTCSSTQRQTVTTNLFNQILASAAYTGQTVYTATKSGSTITFTANTAGAANNADAVVVTKTGTIAVATVDLAGGADAVAAIPAVVVEPIQYSCQQNYTLLVTDGYWNTDSYNDLTQLNSATKIGNQDNVNSGLTARPSYDGALASTTCDDSAFSSCGTLSDIAMYYYKTDLRDSSLGNQISGDTGLDVSVNDVFKSSTDSNQQQHMVLFTMGLGAPGTLRYDSNYTISSTGDYANIVAGTSNWPAVKANDPTTIDDLWHAAVNGRGKYFSARDPQSVVTGLNEALASVQVKEGSAAAAATSNLQPVAGDNFAYVATYTTVEWAGDVQARYIDLTTGAVSTPANASPNECISDTGCAWSAKHKLDTVSWSTRKIYIAPTSAASGAAPRLFAYGNLTATEQAYFNPNTLNQYASVYAAHPTDITATNMVNFLRGDTSLEVGNTGGNSQVWRNRVHVMGDVVSTQPIFLSKPPFTYEDAGYNAFAATQASREGVVYVSGNDGMLHAFAADDFTDGSASGGDELWAYVPTYQLPYLKDLADTNYTHHYYLDGQITIGDVNFGGGTSDWHTILVGGMGGGGKAYYAMDITDPINPKYLWEFTDTNLGYTFGNASINKLPNGEWAVLFSSGYNNTNGVGYLYALNPQTGAIKTSYPLTTASGTASSPSNLGKVSAWVDNLQISNTATHIYAGDMDGDLWRFDLTSHAAFKLAHLADGVTPTPNPQPITTRPELALVDGHRVVYVGTGRYLGIADLADTDVQSFYAIKDTLGSANFSGGSSQVTWNPRTDTDTINGVAGTPMFVLHKVIATKSDGSQIATTDSVGNSVAARQICIGASSQVDATTGNCINENGTSEIDWGTYGGWYLDFPDSGERMNVDMNLTFGTITFASNVPASSACSSGGFGWLNFVDNTTGLGADGDSVVSVKNPNALIVGINVLYVGGKLVADIISSSGGASSFNAPGQPAKFKGERDLWRELDPY